MTRVLLCDDAPDVLLLLGMEFGFHEDLEVVGKAENGARAVALARDLQPDVVVLDLAMPVMDGLEALPMIMDAAPGARVIVLSGFDADTLGAQAKALGAVGYLEKGTEPSQIAAEVKAVAQTIASKEPRSVDLTSGSIEAPFTVYLESKRKTSSGQGEKPDRR